MPSPDRVVAFGASLTMGSQDANISERGQLHGPMAQLTRAAGAYLEALLTDALRRILGHA